MSFLETILVVLMVIAAVVVISAILVQQGKGAEAGAAFGGSGSAGGVFGAAGSANFLSRTTSIAFSIFIACTLGLSYVHKHVSKSSGSALKNLQAQSQQDQRQAAESNPLTLGAASSVTPGASSVFANPSIPAAASSPVVPQ